MKKIIILLIAVILFTACKEEPLMTVTYPETKKVDTVDVYFGTNVNDPYRWLEDDRSAETEAWVKAQNEVTFGYLNQIPFKNELKERLEKIWNFEKVGSPFKEGDYTYFYKNDGLQNQYVLYRKKGEEKAEVFIDPNTFSKDGTVSLGEMSFSNDGSLLAYSISEGGSDWRKIIVLNTENKEIVGDTIKDVKFTRISWKANDGFYYSSYDKPKGSELSAKTDQHKLYYHKLGTPQKDDKVIFGGIESQKRRYVGGSVTNDDKFLFISASESTSGNELYMIDLTNPKSTIIPVILGFDNDSFVLENDGDKLYIVTNLNAPNKRIVNVDAKNPSKENWVDFIPETSNVLNPSKGAGFIFAHYMVDAVSQVKQYDYTGKLVRDIKLPGLGTASGFSGKKADETLYFSFTNYIVAGTSYKFTPKSGDSEVYIKPTIDFNPDDYESNQVFYTSKDGTKVPMIITHKKGLKMNGKNPTILYSYGGFNISLTPSFSIANAVWLENGGIYAVPNIRGGGEYGKVWHDAGTQLKKQNVFDDFIAAAEYLINNKYTSSDYLALRGGSNGGLLVGAVMTQRPELAKVALPAVGVLDMLRYHTFTAGAGWAYDYGTSEQSKEMFEYLKGYSPLHNVVEGIEYPATLITTADHDDRVVPAHSFKFAAELQAKQSGKNPVLIRIETNAGHGAGTPVSKQIEQAADIYAFVLYNMNVKKLTLKK
jgi:prolyl oligopeptidase